MLYYEDEPLGIRDLEARDAQVPDGSGVWYRNAVCEPYAPCANDDDLVLCFFKRLR